MKGSRARLAVLLVAAAIVGFIAGRAETAWVGLLTAAVIWVVVTACVLVYDRRRRAPHGAGQQK